MGNSKRDLFDNMNVFDVTIEKLVDVIISTKGQFFSAAFIKKTDGTFREMQCQLKVRRYVTGKGLNFIPSEHKLIQVYDTKKANKKRQILRIEYKEVIDELIEQYKVLYATIKYRLTKKDIKAIRKDYINDKFIGKDFYRFISINGLLTVTFKGNKYVLKI